MTTTAPIRKKKPPIRYRCAICRAPLRDGEWLYSSHTGNRFCPLNNWKACERRSLKERV